MNAKIYIFSTILSLLTTVSSFGQFKKTIRVKAPDKQTCIELGADKQGQLQYRVFYSGQKVVTWSKLGLQIDGITVGGNTVVEGKEENFYDEKFAWRLGENDTITNRYNRLKLRCVSSSLLYNLIVRVYNGSVAFRYEIPSQSGLKDNSISVKKENTEFNFTTPYEIYQYNQESVFTPVALNLLTQTCDFPATLTNGKLFISIGEADNTDYTKAELKRGIKSNSLVVTFARNSVVKADRVFETPWRTISVAKTAIGLHDYSELYLKLTPAPQNGVPTWIKPGKLIRAQLNTQSGIDCIDFAVKHNFQYIMFDAGWYGSEFRSTSDPTRVIPQIDMSKVIQYGKERGIGVVLYVNYVGLRAKLDTILPLYKKWGVSGMKFGFVDGLTQEGLMWLASAIKKVNDYGFILDIHDNYKPTGLSRTYPALLTQEGIRGDENSPDAFHTTVLPFTRFLAGPADFTFCYPNGKNSYSKNLKVTKGQQLALTVIFFSPLQSIFWYGMPNDYTNEEEIEFFKYVPTVWDESHYLAGGIGENISVARRSGDTWFVGNVTGLKDWESSIRLNFLTKGEIYTATVYEDDGAGGICKRVEKVKEGDEFSFNIKAKGGQAMILRPITKTIQE
ncbi:glycoside hydrolase family 97 catalytic domain-containing protein [uncultured Bacteroides sp.]|uniref:glycoside hydrolase family 97 protein n=1 Tax=uncultured Bacteroides sp. TaxID=162156 RepID=UPI002AA73D01|nr:glycoside hydrolase family 97 catalytic domain-containing protein [uncultured Bacteroides sp.]